MKLIFSHHIKKRELGKKPAKSDLEVIVRSCQKLIYTPITGDIPKNTQLIKVYATSPSGAKRIVYLLEMKTGDRFFLFYRDKDDIIGENITSRNTHFREALSTYLNILEQDIIGGDFEVLDI